MAGANRCAKGGAKGGAVLCPLCVRTKRGAPGVFAAGGQAKAEHC